MIPPGATYCHCLHVGLSLDARSCQFGRANAPTIPHDVQTIRGPNAGTGTASAIAINIDKGIGPKGITPKSNSGRISHRDDR